MLFVLFQLGKDRYALEASRVVEVLPRVDLKDLPCAPRGVVGLLNYRGNPVPVIDLSQMATGCPASDRLSTRVILVEWLGHGGTVHRLGLIAERATETMKLEESDFVSPGVSVPEAPYLGTVSTSENGILQRVIIERLLSPAVAECLFQDARGRP